MNKKILIMFGMLLVIPLMSGVHALSPLAPLFTFEMASHYDVFINGNETTMSLITLHQSSSNWMLYIRHSDADVPPYDNLSIYLQCNNAVVPTAFYTTSYSDWVGNGSIAINFNYQDENYNIYFNSISFDGKYSSCSVRVDGISYTGNGAYEILPVEMIPQLGVIEFISCEGVASSQIGLAQEGLTLVQIMTDVWNIAWIVYSIGVTVISLFGIPILIFMIVRWAIWKITGHRIGGERT